MILFAVAAPILLILGAITVFILTNDLFGE